MATSTIAPIVDLLIMTDLPVASLTGYMSAAPIISIRKSVGTNRLEHGK
jgi:hypothetical protein